VPFINESGQLSDSALGKSPWVIGLKWSQAPQAKWAAVAREQASKAGTRTAGLCVYELPRVETDPVIEDDGENLLAPAPTKRKRKSKSNSQGERRVAFGMWELSFQEEEAKLKRPAGARSVAAAFARATIASGTRHAVLVWELTPIDGQAAPGAAGRVVYLCVVYDGLPTADEVMPLERAIDVAAEERKLGATVFANDPRGMAISGAADMLLDEYLPNWGRDKSFADSALRSVPVNVTAWASAVAIVVVVAVSGVALHIRNKQIQEREAAERAEREDPLPKYMEALAAQRNQAGMSAQDVTRLWAELATSTPVKKPGWDLSKVTCDLHSCIANWRRDGGTFSQLAAMSPQDKLQLPAMERGNVAATQLTTVDDVLPIMSKLSALPAKLPTQAQYTVEAGSIFQRWENAKVQVSAIGAPVVWPSSEGAAQLSGPQIVARAPFEISVDGAFLAEVLAGLPDAARVTQLSVVVSQQGGLTASLKGFHYVRKS